MNLANITDFHRSHIADLTDNDDSSILLLNTNKLLSTAGISAKTILSVEELARVASSMFVAVFESLFHMRIENVKRNPNCKDDYEFNAQLVIDCLSDQIQMDLKHITGKSIVSGNVRALSNLVHIFVRIVNITSHDTLSSIDSGDITDGDIPGNYRNIFRRRTSPATDSISTRDSLFAAAEKDSGPPHYLPGRDHYINESLPAESMKNSAAAFYDAFLRSSLSKADQILQLERRSESARQRRVRAVSERETHQRISNMKHAEASRRALQTRWVEDQERHERSFEMRKASEEHVMLRKIYQGLLYKIMEWRAEGERESKEKLHAVREQAKWHVQSLQSVFDERMRLLREEDQSFGKDRHRDVREENERTNQLLQSITERQTKAIKSLRNTTEQKKQKELLRRQEMHENLLSLLTVEDVFRSKPRSARDRCVKEAGISSMSTTRLMKSRKRSSSAPRPLNRHV